jgi:recombination protein RecA
MASHEQDREKAVELAIAQIERQFGKGSIMRLGGAEIIDVPVIPTGSLSLDMALGVGGIPRGRVIEIYGPESGGKTTLALHIVSEAQKMGGLAAFVDAEHALDVAYARKIGVDVDNLLIAQPDTGEQALEIAETLVRSGALDVLVIDSVAALVPKAELEGDMGDAQMGLQARLMSQALRKLTGTISKSKTCVIFINQLRMKIGMFMGNPETTTGGNALKFYASMRLDIRKITALKQGENVVGNRVRVKVVKNKVAPPSARPSSTSFSAKASRRKATCWISPSTTALSSEAAPGIPTRATVSARAGRTCASPSRTIRKCWPASRMRSARSSG